MSIINSIDIGWEQVEMVEALDTKVQQDGNWISFSALDKEMYTKLLTGVTLASSLVTHPLFVMTTRMQVGLETTVSSRSSWCKKYRAS